MLWGICKYAYAKALQPVMTYRRLLGCHKTNFAQAFKQNLVEAFALLQGVREAGLSGGKAGLPLTQMSRKRHSPH
jgi:hypothetical protein